MTDQEKLKKYQDLTFEMLVAFQAFCAEHSLTWMLAGGSALGALRHQGFIPWDDDVDLAMPRSHFEKLEALMDKNGSRLDKYVYSPVEDQIVPEAPIGHLYYPGVTEKIVNAPKLDIHPLDYVPDGKLLKERQKIYSLIYFLGIYHLPTKNKGRFFHDVSAFALRAIPENGWKKIKKKARRIICRTDKSNYICSIFGAGGYEKEIVPANWMFPCRETMFNGVKMPVPAQCVKYLSRLYGDWRQLPPESDRHPVHDNYKELL